MTISIIVAVAENQVIGYNNQLLWRLKEDLQRFKGLTMGHHIIMGRKTYESVGRPLPGRTNVIITRNKDFKADGCLMVGSLDEAIKVANSDSEVFIIGGGEIYNQSLPIADKIYLTRVHASFPGDTFFPELDLTEWVTESITKGKPVNDNELGYTFIDLVRVKNKS
jgi:dihydrofolate reductase